MKIENFKIGTDPELFLEKDGKIISAEGLIGGTKKEPKLISEYGHAIQEDNVMVEFNTPPSTSAKEFVDNINFVKDYLETLASVYGAKLNYTTSARLTDEELSTDQARMFGCDPSYNVYLKDVSPAPSARSKYRSCGGHIHIGYDNPSQEVTEQIIYGMDMILGLQSVSLDSDTIRKKSYGKAGEFRFKSFGCEWRTLSNFWIKNDELIKWAYESTALVIDIVNSDIIESLIDKYSEDVRKAIDTSDKELANTLYQSIQEELVKSKIIEKKKELILN